MAFVVINLSHLTQHLIWDDEVGLGADDVAVVVAVVLVVVVAVVVVGEDGSPCW